MEGFLRAVIHILFLLPWTHIHGVSQLKPGWADGIWMRLSHSINLLLIESSLINKRQ